MPRVPREISDEERYAHPIPGRDAIIDHLEAAGIPMSRKRLGKELGLESQPERAALARRLNAMVRDGQLVVDRRNVYGLVRRMDLVTGTVFGARDGSGILRPENGEADCYLDSQQMRMLFPGDRIVARQGFRDLRGRVNCEVVEVLERNTFTLVGRFHREREVALVEPLNRQIGHEVLIEPGNQGGAVPGQIVVVEITSQPSMRHHAVGRISNILGEHLRPGMEVEIALQMHNIPTEWPDAVLAETERIASGISRAERRRRKDLTGLPFVTIDGEDARDFDDAVLCEARRGGGWRLYVAIADVSRFVRPGSALDAEAYNRGTSVYFPRSVVPMLPEKLSNGLCSLRPGEDRLTIVCEMTVSAKGRVGSFRFYEAIIHSRARLTYTEVGALLEVRAGGPRSGEAFGKAEPLRPQLEALHALYGRLARARASRGALDFDTVETAFSFDETGHVSAIEPLKRNVAHRIIEECMLCANVCAARLMEKLRIPTLYRVHEGATEERLYFLRQFLAQFGVSLGGGEAPDPGDYNAVLAGLRGRPGSRAIQTALLRSLSQAVYQPSNKGHFGLNYPHYAHFTSPIRRYPDLMVHRAIAAVIRSDLAAANVERVQPGASPFEENYFYTVERMAVIGEHCSMAERRADESSWDVDAWLKCEFIQERVGEEFDGVVSAVTGFGLFIELDGVYVEGLVHISALRTDYYHYDAGTQCLVGERSGRIYGVGDRVSVQVVRVDVDDRKIDLDLIDHQPLKGRKRDVLRPKGKRRRAGVRRRDDARARTRRR